MASDLAEKAREAFLDDDFKLSVDFYTKAIELRPDLPDLFADRAQANIKLQNFTEAVADTSKAIELDRMMSKAYLRKGIACMKLEEYHTAKPALELGASLAPDDARFRKLMKECDQHIADEENELNLPVTPNSPLASAGTNQINSASSAKPKYRHEYYQKAEEVVVTIFAKKIPAEKVAVDFGEQILSVAIDAPEEEAYHLQTRLFGKIVPEKCKYEVLSTKVEIRLAKAEYINWTSLEYSKETTVLQKPNMSSVGSERPVYPSSKTKAKDWDKLEALVKKEEKEEKLDGDAALNKFFRQIYLDGDEDMRRAMSKSFVESNGTVLSTDWKEVGTKKVEGSAPKGMEMRKREY